jgi:hypothetical protein
MVGRASRCRPVFVEREVAKAQRIEPTFILFISALVVPQGDEGVYRAGGRLLVLVGQQDTRSCDILGEVMLVAVEGEESMAAVSRCLFLTIDRQL